MRIVRMALFAGALAFGGVAQAEDVVGKWVGVVKSPEAEIPLNLSVTREADGKLAATAESPTQAPGMVIPTENVTSDGDRFSFDVSMAQGAYAGAWDAEAKKWVGVWTQGGMEMPLEFKRSE